MTWAIIIFLILIGFTALILEILVIPGFGVVGIIGVIGIGFGVYEAYYTFGNFAGNITLASTLIFTIILTIIILRSNTWKKLMLKSQISSKVNEIPENILKVGMTGTTVSRLAPSGKARIANEIYEVDTYGLFIDQNQEIEILKIEQNKIIVTNKN